MSTQRLQSNPFDGLRNLGCGFRLPSPAKFQNGLVSGVTSRPLSVSRNDIGSGSDMEIGTDSDEEVYGAQYSVDSSPQDDKVPNWRKQWHAVDRLGGGDGNGNGNGGYQVVRSVITDDESPDSVAGSKISSTLFRYSKGDVSLGRAEKNKELPEGGIPSAPPFAGIVHKINRVPEQILNSKAQGAPRSKNSKSSEIMNEPFTTKTMTTGSTAHEISANNISNPSVRTEAVDAAVSSSLPVCLPTFHASGLGPWCAVISYDACVRLCLHSWARGCMEAPIFLENECAMLRNAFGLQQILLQPEEELLKKPSSELVTEGAALKPRKTLGKMKVQVRKVKMAVDPPQGCTFPSLKPPIVKLESLQAHVSNIKSTISSGWGALKNVHLTTRIPANATLRCRSLAYLHAGTQYMKEVFGLVKVGVTTLRHSSSPYEVVQETYSCSLRLKSLSEEEAIRMQPGSGETLVFLPDGLGDDLIIEVQDSKGRYYGRVVAQLAIITDNPGDKLRWWSIYHEPEHELVGRVQLFINYSTSPDENNHLKCGSVAETVSYNFVLETAMKVQNFQQRNLLLHGQWKWLVTEFASYYGVSDAYTKLRYVSYVMDVATPTADCLFLVHELLVPVVMKGDFKRTLSHQENRILGEVFDRIEQILALVFENYKSLEESSPSGLVDVFRPATGVAAPALEPALKLFNLFHDILSPEAQLKLCRYFQVAAKKRSRMQLAETDEFASNNNGSILMDPVTLSIAYQKMKSLCLGIKNEIYTDLEIHNQQVLPSFVDLPNLSASIYGVELFNRLRAFFAACSPIGLSPPVAELVITTADFQRDLASWNINVIKGGVDAKELFHLYIVRWIQDKRLALLELCKLDKVKWCGIKRQSSTTPFVDDMFNHLKGTLSEYEVIICRWPEYAFLLENAVADVEKAVVEALEKQYADVLFPLKDNLAPIKFGLKYVHKFSKTSLCLYTVPDELGVILNSMKRMLDVLLPKVEAQLQSWGSCIPDGENTVPGELLSEVTVMLRTKFRNYLQAVVEKLAENTRVQNATKLKRIILDTKESVVESDVSGRMQPLKDTLTRTIDNLHNVFENHVFIIVCRGFWDKMGQDLLKFLENGKENGLSWYKGSRVVVSILNDTFASQMQQLLGNLLQEEDLEPPRSILQVHSMLFESCSCI